MLISVNGETGQVRDWAIRAIVEFFIGRGVSDIIFVGDSPIDISACSQAMLIRKQTVYRRLISPTLENNGVVVASGGMHTQYTQYQRASIQCRDRILTHFKDAMSEDITFIIGHNTKNHIVPSAHILPMHDNKTDVADNVNAILKKKAPL